jgi:predicted transposase YdaD
MQTEVLLQQVAQRLSQIDQEQRQEISEYTQILAGLKFEKELIQRLFREGMMRESVIYQEILEEGHQEGRQKGCQEGGRRLFFTNLLDKSERGTAIAHQHPFPRAARESG